MTKLNTQHPDYLFMIEQAVKAPSGHNTQPWLFKVGEANIRILPNFDRTLPVVDPDYRELFISLGCATENLCLAASQKGYTARLDISDEGIITIYLTKDTAVDTDPLFNQIHIRQTNRSVYNGRIIPADTIGLLKSVLNTSTVRASFYENGTQQFDQVAGYIIRGNELQMQDSGFTDELKSWMRYNKKHQDETNDGLSYAVFGAPNMPRFIVKPIMSRMLNDRTQNKGDRKKIASSSHFVLFTTTSNTPEGWIHLGILLERFLLKSTKLGIVHAYANQPNEVSELAAGMAATLRIPDGEYPAVLLRIGYGERMAYSKRMAMHKVILND